MRAAPSPPPHTNLLRADCACYHTHLMNLILTGSIAIDRIMVYEGNFSDVIQPDKIHQLSLSVHLKDLKDTPGGVAANIAYTLALLGARPVLYGSIGKEATAYLERLKNVGIDTSQTHLSNLPTATFTVMTDLANCQIGGFYPGAMSDAKALTIKKFASPEDFIVISPHDPDQMRVQVAECTELKKRMFYDVGQQVSNIPAEDLRAGVSAAELLIVNDYEMDVISKKTGWSKADIQRKAKICITTLGAEGCFIHTQDGKEIIVSALKIDKVIDPTGAGDAFRAGFLYGYSNDYSIEDCAKLGSTAAAFCIEKQGAQGHTFTKEEFFTRYKSSDDRRHDV